VTGTPSGIRLTGATLREASAIDHSAASKVFSRGPKWRTILSPAIKAMIGVGAIIVVIKLWGVASVVAGQTVTTRNSKPAAEAISSAAATKRTCSRESRIAAP